jgi:arylsulfatase A-like enzyme
VVGRTDGREIQERPVTVPDFFATLYRAFGISPQKEHRAAGRPLKLVEGGAPVDDLF